jgi:hypothetical protein
VTLTSFGVRAIRGHRPRLPFYRRSGKRNRQFACNTGQFSIRTNVAFGILLSDCRPHTAYSHPIFSALPFGSGYRQRRGAADARRPVGRPSRGPVLVAQRLEDLSVVEMRHEVATVANVQRSARNSLRKTMWPTRIEEFIPRSRPHVDGHREVLRGESHGRAHARYSSTAPGSCRAASRDIRAKVANPSPRMTAPAMMATRVTRCRRA